MTYGASRGGWITEKQERLQAWTSVERSSDARLSSEPKKLESSMDGTPQRGRRFSRVEIRRGDSARPAIRVRRGPMRRAGETDDRIVECMDGGGLVEKDDFLVARGRFLGIGTDSNGTPGQLHLDTMGLESTWPSLQSTWRCIFGMLVFRMSWSRNSKQILAKGAAAHGTKEQAREAEDPKPWSELSRRREINRHVTV
ncbi:hypothetical protein B0H13DRAFT_1896972 [Mycena leptocephala]|nr:hypothetical protein B0H13DRAFT_1896972 [Mycena leptocephala]